MDKQRGLFILPCVHFANRHRSFFPSLSPCPAASRWWLIRIESEPSYRGRGKSCIKDEFRLLCFPLGGGGGGARGERKLWIYARCDWTGAQTQGTDVEHGERWGWLWRWVQELVLDRCGTFWQAAGGSRRSCTTSTDSPFTPCNGSWHHNYIIMASFYLFIQLGAT